MLILSRAQALAYYKASSDAKMLGGICDMTFRDRYCTISVRQLEWGEVIVAFTSDNFISSEGYKSLEDWADAYAFYL